jgi:hypothetical protein
LKDYSKLQLILVIGLTVFAAYLLTSAISGSVSINYLVVVPYWVGTALFAANEKGADYVALAIFTFEFSGVVAARRELYGPLTFARPEEWIAAVLTGLAAIFIVSNIFRRSNHL